VCIVAVCLFAHQTHCYLLICLLLFKQSRFSFNHPISDQVPKISSRNLYDLSELTGLNINLFNARTPFPVLSEPSYGTY